MKYVGRVDDGNFLFAVSEQELSLIKYGMERPEYEASTKEDVLKFKQDLRNGKVSEFSISEKFKKIVSMYHMAKSFDDWQSFTTKMKDITNLFTPVKEYIDKFKEVDVLKGT